jgi:twitching motility protein PilT
MTNPAFTTTDLLRALAETPGASDLILTVGKEPQLRIYNEVLPLADHPVLGPEDTERLCLAVLSEEQKARFRADREFDCSLELEGIGRFRVNVFMQRGSVGLVARIVMDTVPGFEKLGLPPIITELAKLRKGLILFTGPAGTGKSTSVASLLDYINHHRPCHIITIEDPIEYVHTHARATIEQREVGIDTDTFHSALRRVLRQAPDVVVIGEIRDRESAQAALTLAETGHLIIATLHTSGAVASINRIIDMFAEEQKQQIRSQVSVSLAAVLWQQLLPGKDRNSLALACEVMVTIPAIRALIRQGRLHEMYSLIQTGRKFGMVTMEQSIQELAAANAIDPTWLQENYFDLSTHKKAV